MDTVMVTRWRLSEIMEDLGITGRDLARELGLKREGTISDWKRCQTLPNGFSGEKLDALAAALNKLGKPEKPLRGIDLIYDSEDK